MFLSIYLSIYLSVCLSIYLFICLFFCTTDILQCCFYPVSTGFSSGNYRHHLFSPQEHQCARVIIEKRCPQTTLRFFHRQTCIFSCFCPFCPEHVLFTFQEIKTDAQDGHSSRPASQKYSHMLKTYVFIF